MTHTFNSRPKVKIHADISVHDRVVQDYFRLTSAISYTDNYQAKTQGLRRGLGNWLNVRGKRVLDLGCGTGELCWLANDMNAQKVLGVNLSKEETLVANLNVNAEFVCQDIYSYLCECPSESFDTIYALNILEHLSKDDLVAVLDEVRRCLRMGGHIVAMVPNATSVYGAMTRYWDITHILAFTPSSVQQLMRLSGYSNVEFMEWGPRIHGFVSFCRYMLWQTIRVKTKLRLMIETGSDKGGIYTADMLFRLTK